MIMGMDDDVVEVVGKEQSLLRTGVRSSPDAVLGLLHEEFREFGASGRVWDREQIAAALAEDPGRAAEAEDMRPVRLGDDVVLLTYVARRPDRVTLRSSVWVRGTEGWRLFFHQGTVCP